MPQTKTHNLAHKCTFQYAVRNSCKSLSNLFLLQTIPHGSNLHIFWAQKPQNEVWQLDSVCIPTSGRDCHWILKYNVKIFMISRVKDFRVVVIQRGGLTHCFPGDSLQASTQGLLYVKSYRLPQLPSALLHTQTIPNQSFSAMMEPN